ncbi:MAG: serine/threonine protein kinase [Phycisphaeraceae bacterium]|nr:serine/threonine protein kinase [Phycisphaeraceae bacterium]
MSEPNEQPDASNPINIAETDAPMPRQWLSGSLKYTDFMPLTEGGTAELQTCLDKNLHRTVVYKTLHDHLQSSDLETARFLREARVTAMIAHPGTVPVYELGRDRSGELFFTMKKLEGQDLRSILMSIAAKDRMVSEQYPLAVLVDVLIQTCQTVSYAHKQGVIHRDLKPANILVGEFGEVTVLDWGLAKVRGETPSSAVEEAVVKEATGKKAVSLELTQPGKRYGTPLYMSPEQARGDDSLDERTDVYNLGSVLFEMLTAKNLVWGNDVEEVLAQVLERPTPVPSEMAPERDVPPELEAICLKALQKDPADRYSSVNELFQDLSAYRTGRPISVYRASALVRLVRWRDRHALPLTAALGVLVGVLLCWAVLKTL